MKKIIVIKLVYETEELEQFTALPYKIGCHSMYAQGMGAGI